MLLTVKVTLDAAAEFTQIPLPRVQLVTPLGHSQPEPVLKTDP